MTQEAKILGIIGVITLVVLVGGIFFLTKNTNSSSTSTQTPVDPNVLIKEDSHKLDPSIKDASPSSVATSSGKVQIVEFGDYQCPACRQAYPVIKQILKDESGKVIFIFRNFPLTQHQKAQIAAEAAEAAGAQGKYWEMHDKLYETQDKWSDSTSPLDIFVGFAKDLGLNVDKFKTDVSSNKYQDKINQDLGDGNVLGINQTPTFFINGIESSGVLSDSEFKAKIDQLH